MTSTEDVFQEDWKSNWKNRWKIIPLLEYNLRLWAVPWKTGTVMNGEYSTHLI